MRAVILAGILLACCAGPKPIVDDAEPRDADTRADAASGECLRACNIQLTDCLMMTGQGVGINPSDCDLEDQRCEESCRLTGKPQ
jgi:hypothetical protein